MLSYWTIRTAVRSVNMCWSRTGYRERAGIRMPLQRRVNSGLWRMDREVAWSLVIGIILLYGNVVLRMAILGKSGYLAKTVCLVLLAIVMLLGIDYLTGYRRWSLDYVLPGGIIAIDLALFILILINRRNWQSYMMSELLTILLSIVPVVLLQMRIIHFPYLAWGSLGVSVFLFLGTLILGDQRARTELKRRFHI